MNSLVNRLGFTLVELTITLGIFALVMLAGSSFLIQVIQSASQSAVQNEVRQNASVILQDIISQMRRALCVYYEAPSPPPPPTPLYVNNALLRLSDDPNGVKCTSGNRVEYYQDQNGVIIRAATDSGGIALSFGILTSINTVVLDCSAAGVACGLASAGSCVAGLVVSSSGGSMPITNGTPAIVSVRAQQIPGLTRSDTCAAIKLSDTITPRVR